MLKRKPRVICLAQNNIDMYYYNQSPGEGYHLPHPSPLYLCGDLSLHVSPRANNKSRYYVLMLKLEA